MDLPVDPAHLAALCPELRAVVDDAATAGNPVVETWTGFGQVVRLRAPRPVLVGLTESQRADLRYLAVDDPHYWLGEIHCRLHRDWCVALPYASPSDADPSGLADLGLARHVPR